jgi:hypothetical protein
MPIDILSLTELHIRVLVRHRRSNRAYCTCSIFVFKSFVHSSCATRRPGTSRTGCFCGHAGTKDKPSSSLRARASRKKNKQTTTLRFKTSYAFNAIIILLRRGYSIGRSFRVKQHDARRPTGSIRRLSGDR